MPTFENIPLQGIYFVAAFGKTQYSNIGQQSSFLPMANVNVQRWQYLPYINNFGIAIKSTTTYHHSGYNMFKKWCQLSIKWICVPIKAIYTMTIEITQSYYYTWEKAAHKISQLYPISDISKMVSISTSNMHMVFSE